MVQNPTNGGPAVLAPLTEHVQEMVQRHGARPSTELRLLQMVSSEDSKSSASLHVAPHALEDDLVLPVARLPSLRTQ